MATDPVQRVTTWIDAYVRAWNTNDPADIAALFTADATYRPAPYEEPQVGSAAITQRWLEHQDAPGDTTFTWHPVVVTEDVAVVQGSTTYPGQVFSNLWVIRLDADGRCAEFTEWWMLRP